MLDLNAVGYLFVRFRVSASATERNPEVINTTLRISAKNQHHHHERKNQKSSIWEIFSDKYVSPQFVPVHGAGYDRYKARISTDNPIALSIREANHCGAAALGCSEVQPASESSICPTYTARPGGRDQPVHSQLSETDAYRNSRPRSMTV